MSTWPESTRLGAFLESSVIFMVYGVNLSDYIKDKYVKQFLTNIVIKLLIDGIEGEFVGICYFIKCNGCFELNESFTLCQALTFHILQTRQLLFLNIELVKW